MNKQILIDSWAARQVEIWLEHDKLRYRAPAGTMTPELLAQLQQDKAALVAALTPLAPPTTCGQEGAPFALTPVQAAYLAGRNSVYGYGGTGCHGYFEIDFATLDGHRVEQTWRTLVQRHGMLRVVIDPAGHQAIQPEVAPYRVVEHAWQKWEEQERENAVAALRERLSHRQYDPAQWPLFTVEVSQHPGFARLHISIDLLIADFASIHLLLSEFAQCYHAPETALAPCGLNFQHYLQLAQGDASERQRDRRYWLERLASLPPAPDLPVATDGQHSQPRFKRWSHTLAPPSWLRFQELATARQLTPSAALLAAFAEVLARYSSQPRFTLNLTLMARQPVHPDVSRLVGDFTQVTLLAVDCSGSNSFGERARQLQNRLWEDIEHARFTGVEVLRERARSNIDTLMPVVFTSTLGAADPVAPGIARLMEAGAMAYAISQTPQVWIDCQAMAYRGALSLAWDVRIDVFPAGFIDAMYASFSELVDSMANDPSVWDASSVTALATAQSTRRAAVNGTTAPAPEGCLHSAAEAQAERHPHAPALIGKGWQMSHGELLARARALAHRLVAAGVQPGEPVGMVMDKGASQVVAALAVLHAAAAYVPIDAALPLRRQQAMWRDAGVRCLLAQAHNADALASHSGLPVLVPDNALPPHTPAQLPPRQSPAGLAYIIYTSGSTGQPKGVRISHQAALNTVVDIIERYRLDAQDRVLAVAQLSFDLSVFDIFGLLGVGGAVVLPQPEDRNDPARWAALMLAHGVTVWNSVPAQMQMLVAYLDSHPAPAKTTLRRVLLSGDWIAPALPPAVRKHFPAARVTALGGATEAAIWSSHFETEDDTRGWTNVPYGKPLRNQYFRVLNNRGEEAPDWVAGELCIGGSGLAQGYHGDAERTAERFIAWGPKRERLYRTGDLGRYRPDGRLEFLGRIDTQVKLRGQRIELAEIETILQTHAGIEAAVAQIVDTRLVAHVLPKTEDAPIAEATQTEAALRAAWVDAERASHQIDAKAVREFAATANHVALLRMRQALVDTGALIPGAAPVDSATVVAQGAIAPPLAGLVQRWLMVLEREGLLQATAPGLHALPTQLAPTDTQQEESRLEQLAGRLHDGTGLLDFLRANQAMLPALLRGQADARDLLFPEGRLDIAQAAYRDNLASRTLNGWVCDAVLAIVHSLDRPVRILEIGAGVGGTSDGVIAALAQAGLDAAYWFTDISPFFLQAARERYAAHGFMHYARFDLNEDPHAQGVPPHSFDLVIAANVLHDAKRIDAACRLCTAMLVPGGWLIALETTQSSCPLMCSMEFLDGLRAFEDERRETHNPFLSVPAWQHHFEAAGARSVAVLPTASHPLAVTGQHVMALRTDRGRRLPDLGQLRVALRERLPEVMVPTQFHWLTHLPLSDNGKVDRRALPTPALPEGERHSSDAAAAVPATPLEIQLADIWCSLLGRTSVGRSDNFFRLGGDSLLVAQLIGKLRDTLGAERVPWELTLRHFVNHATVGELAAHLNTIAAHGTPLVNAPSQALLLRDGKAPSLYLFHDGMGHLLPYRALLQTLPVGPAVRGFAVSDSAAYLAMSPQDVIPQLAERYAAAIQHEQPEGPVRLLGYCMGGLLGLEVARVLKGRGREIGLLASISSYRVPYRLGDPCLAEYAYARLLGVEPGACGLPGDETAVGQALEAALRINPSFLSIDSLSATGASAAIAATFSRYQAAPETVRLGKLWGSCRDQGRHLNIPDEAAFVRGFHVFRHSLEAVTHYAATPYAGHAVFFRQRSSTHFLPGLRNGMTQFWRDTCLGEIHVLELAGDHFTCLDDPALSAQLAPLIGAMPTDHAGNAP